MYLNLSGVENMAAKLYESSGDKSLVAAFVFDYIGRAIVKICKELYEVYGRSTIVAAGGVMCNSIVKRVMSDELDVVFAEPRLSSDNAVGVGLLALDAYKASKNL
jgi:N6-L-threonylcarbamoyladenine synthase